MNFWIMGELLNYRWTIELWVNFWIMGEPLICVWQFWRMNEILVTFWIIGELLNYGLTFDLWVNFWLMGELLSYGQTFKSWVYFWILSKIFNYGCTFELLVNPPLSLKFTHYLIFNLKPSLSCFLKPFLFTGEIKPAWTQQTQRLYPVQNLPLYDPFLHNEDEDDILHE